MITQSTGVIDIDFEISSFDLVLEEVDLEGLRLCENLEINFPPPQNDTTICRGEEVLLDFSKTGMTYQWQDGSTESTFLVSTSGTYTVLIEKCDQSVLREVEVTVEDCPCHLEIPNAFTPDADGTNDYFKILHDCPITDFQMEIYNRWGRLVFSSTNVAFGWDGTKGGQVLPSDVYIYKYQYRFNGGIDAEMVQEYGDVSLIR